MNNKGNFLMSLLALLFGAAFIWLHNHVNLIDTLVLLVGLAFVVPGVLSILSLFLSKKVQQASAIARGIQAICTVGGLALGIVIIVMPNIFRPWLVYLFGALMIMGGATQVLQIAQRTHRGDYPTWMYFPPIAVLVAGVVTMVFPWLHEPAHEPVMVLVSGIAFAVYGFNGLLVSILRKKVKTPEPAKTEEPKGEEHHNQEPDRVEEPKEEATRQTETPSSEPSSAPEA